MIHDLGKDDVGVEIFIREAVESRKDYSFLSAGGDAHVFLP